VKLAVLGTLGAWALVDPKTLSLPQSVSSFKKKLNIIHPMHRWSLKINFVVE